MPLFFVVAGFYPAPSKKHDAEKISVVLNLSKKTR